MYGSTGTGRSSICVFKTSDNKTEHKPVDFDMFTSKSEAPEEDPMTGFVMRYRRIDLVLYASHIL